MDRTETILFAQDLLIEFVQKWIRYDQLKTQAEANEYYAAKDKIKNFLAGVPVEDMNATVQIIGKVFDELDINNPDHARINKSLFHAIDVACKERLICLCCWKCSLESVQPQENEVKRWRCKECGKDYAEVCAMGRVV